MSKIAKTILALIVFLLPVVAMAQDKTISGKVTDENGKGLASVTVQAKGTKNATTTSDDGTFKLASLNGKEVLVFTYVGYLPQEVSINNRSLLNISMSLDTKVGRRLL